MKLLSTDFDNDEPLPYSCGMDHGDESPDFEIEDVPATTVSLAMVMHDPDAPSGDFTHWLVWNLPPTTTEFNADDLPPGAVQGTNDMGQQDYIGPKPPSGTHHYHFVLYALDTSPNLPSATRRQVFDQAVDGHIVAESELVGLYSAS